MDKKPPKVEVGDESVVIGNVTGPVGNRSVVIGATDNKGNTILNQPMAVGYRAQADPTSIAIGAFARAGVSDNAQLMAELIRVYEAMKQASDATAHQESVAQVGHAIEAAKENDRVSVLTHLKAAGYSALGYATNVSASMAATVIMEALKNWP
jgi:hypothetical protein